MLIDQPESGASRPAMTTRVLSSRARNERLLQPEVDRSQDLVAIEDEDDAIAEARQARPRHPSAVVEVAAGRARDRGQEAAWRGLDRAGVEAEDDRAARLAPRR